MSAVSYPDDTQLAGLIQAATAAADQEHEWQDVEEITSGGHDGRDSQQQHTLEQNGDNSIGYTHEISASQIDPSIQGLPMATEMGPLRRSSTRKRKRAQSPACTSENAQDNRTVPRDGDGMHPVDLTDARAAGVHSATALFRQPSANSKKFSRPPMSKMFASLEISPENFLHLQAAAKTYMLDPNHPERRDCVGQRGRGDTDMVKLKLWNCVKDFLAREGNGERFFGENTVNEGMPEKKYIWPRDGDTIIKLAMPLLRRMVTNERQRQYANNTRKGGDKRHDRNAESDDAGTPVQFQPQNQLFELLGQSTPTIEESDSLYTRLCNLHDLEHFYEDSYLMPDDFKSLIVGIYGHFRYSHGDDPGQCSDECGYQFCYRIFTWEVFSKFTSEQQTAAFSAIRELFGLIRSSFFDMRPPTQDRTLQASTQQPPQAPVAHPHDPPPIEGQFPLPDSLTFQVHILRNQKRVFGPFDIADQTCPAFSELKRMISDQYSNSVGSGSEIIFDAVKAWLPDGLATVQTEDEWVMTFWSAARVDWMDGVLKVLVEMPFEGE